VACHAEVRLPAFSMSTHSIIRSFVPLAFITGHVGYGPMAFNVVSD